MFQVGDLVEWTSQANGGRTKKEGVVVEVVQAGALPDRTLFRQLYTSSGIGMARTHVSYVVNVGRKIYWPRVTHLQAAPHGNHEAYGPLGELVASVEIERDVHRGRYAFFGTGASGTTDDLHQAATWMHMTERHPEALYIRLDIYQNVLGCLKFLRDASIIDGDSMIVMSPEMSQRIHRLVSEGLAELYTSPVVKHGS